MKSTNIRALKGASSSTPVIRTTGLIKNLEQARGGGADLGVQLLLQYIFSLSSCFEPQLYLPGAGEEGFLQQNSGFSPLA